MEEREEKFFKGPWSCHYHYDPRRNVDHVTIESESDDPDHKGADIAEFNLNEWDDDEEKTVVATAKLIAAAPELYDALKVALPYIEDMDTPKIENLARVALQKARGQQ